MTLSPIPKALSTMREHGVEALLMGGQACVLYGAAEFSRDADFAVLASQGNLERLSAAMDALQAEVVAVPPFEAPYLERGHAVHFRCKHPDAMNLRIDVMAHLRGVDPFDSLWSRRTTWDFPEGFQMDSLSLPDLVASKKTQRDKDWPMVRRLVEASYDQDFSSPTPERIDFWLRELRTPELLIDCTQWFPEDANRLAGQRTAIQAALSRDIDAVREELGVEETRERALDRAYWDPLKAELEARFMPTWTLEKAKNQFGEVVRRALNHEPQIITRGRGGEDAVVVLARSEYERLVTPRNLVDFLHDSPLAEAVAAGAFGDPSESDPFIRARDLDRSLDLT